MSDQEDIAQHAKDAIKIVADAAATALKVTQTQTGLDHDSITKLTIRMEDVMRAIKELGDGVSKKIDNHEVRINKLETAKTTTNTLLSVGIGILSLLASLMIYHLAK